VIAVAAEAQPLPGMEVAARHERAGSLAAAPGASGLPAAGDDFLDVFRLGRNDWAVLVGDVAGRGDAAAAAVDLALTAIRQESVRAFLPSTALVAANRALQHAPDDRFCTAVFARLELDKCGTWVTLAAAGHPRPIVVRRAGWLDVRGNVCLPLGLFPDARVSDDRVGLGPGDALVVCSNGLTETVGPDGEAFGAEVLLNELLAAAGAPAEEVADRVLEAARSHARAVPDDAAVFVTRVPDDLGPDPVARVVEATGIPADELVLPGYPLGDVDPDLWQRAPEPPREARMRMTAEAAGLAPMRALLRRLLHSWRMPDEGDGVIELLATELAANVIDHAGDAAMTLIIRYLGPAVRVEVGDGSRELPRRREAGPADLDGRGLALLEALASSWGVVPTRAGKRVWFEVAVGTPM
jgi:anti-sigma regulatory factor (Ser/Thr protein kinase)